MLPLRKLGLVPVRTLWEMVSSHWQVRKLGCLSLKSCPHRLRVTPAFLVCPCRGCAPTWAQITSSARETRDAMGMDGNCPWRPPGWCWHCCREGMLKIVPRGSPYLRVGTASGHHVWSQMNEKVFTSQPVAVSTSQHGTVSPGPVNVCTYQHVRISTSGSGNVSVCQPENVSTLNILTCQCANVSTFQHVNVSTSWRVDGNLWMFRQS